MEEELLLAVTGVDEGNVFGQRPDVELEVDGLVDEQVLAVLQAWLHAWPFHAEVLRHGAHQQKDEHCQYEGLGQLPGDTLEAMLPSTGSEIFRVDHAFVCGGRAAEAVASVELGS